MRRLALALRTSAARALAAALAVGALAACGGPSSDPETSMENYFDCAISHDWKCMVGMLPPELAKKKGKQVLGMMMDDWEKCVRLDYKIQQASVSGDFATVQVTYEYDWRGIDARDITTYKDQYASYTMKRISGKWYVVPPGAEKLGAF